MACLGLLSPVSLLFSLYPHPFKSSLLNTAQTTPPSSALIFSAKQPSAFLWCPGPADITVFRASLVTPVVHQSYFLKKKKVPSHGISGIAVRLTLLFFINWFFCCRLVAQSCPTLYDPTDYSPPGSFILGISWARMPGWVGISFFGGSSWLRNQTCGSCISSSADRFSTTEPQGKPQNNF